MLSNCFCVYIVGIAVTFILIHQTKCYVSLQIIFDVFRAGRVPAKYARHCAALRGQHLRLLTDYAALASAYPGVRYQTMLLRYVIVKHLLLKYMVDFHLCRWATSLSLSPTSSSICQNCHLTAISCAHIFFCLLKIN